MFILTPPARNLTFRAEKYFADSHAAGPWESWDLNPLIYPKALTHNCAVEQEIKLKLQVPFGGKTCLCTLTSSSSNPFGPSEGIK